MKCIGCGSRMTCRDSRHGEDQITRRRYQCEKCGLWAKTEEKVHEWFEPRPQRRRHESHPQIR